MPVYTIEVEFYTGDTIEIEVEADNEQQALDFAVPKTYYIIGEED